MKKLISVATGIAMLGLFASTASAATLTNSGSQSRLRLTNNFENSTRVSNNNSATVLTTINSENGSGENTVSSFNGDVKNNTISTGPVSSTATVTNAVNAIDSTVSAPSACGCDSSGDTLTNNSSQSRLTLTNNQESRVRVRNTNSATAITTLGVDNSSGENKVRSTHGDVSGNGITAGGSTNTSTVAYLLNGIMSAVIR